MCGLFAWNGDNINKFDWTKFNLLGLLNDSRGGDSCGRSYLNTRTIGTGKFKTYESLVKGYRNGLLRFNTILGHTRKASVGTISEKTAQPVVLKEGNNNVFHLIHNGTLLNYKELATKYNIEQAGKTDSQILAEIIYNEGTEVLKEYNGAAALVFSYNDDPNTIYAWKGESKNIQNGTYRSTERPLHYYKEQDGSMYISSLQDPLEFIDGESGGEDPTVFTFEDNHLYTITNGEIISKQKINRVNNYQKVATYTNNNYNNYASTNTSNKTKSIEFNDVSNPCSVIVNKIYYSKGRFWIGKEFANGIYYINKTGFVRKERPSETDGSFVIFYFIRGVMIKDHDSFQKVCRAIKQNERGCVNRLVESQIKNELLLVASSLYPIQKWTVTSSHCVTGFLRSAKSVRNNNTFSGYFSGIFQPLFSTRSYKIGNGDVTKVTDADYLEPIIKPTNTETIEINKGSEDLELNTKTFNSRTLDEEMEDADNKIISEECKKILNDLDEVVMEAKNRVSIIGPTNDTAGVMDSLETIQESISEIVEELD